jgi:hypothetical protein
MAAAKSRVVHPPVHTSKSRLVGARALPEPAREAGGDLVEGLQDVGPEPASAESQTAQPAVDEDELQVFGAVELEDGADPLEDPGEPRRRLRGHPDHRSNVHGLQKGARPRDRAPSPLVGERNEPG